MALAYYDLATGIVHKTVYADDQTDEELEAERVLQKGEGLVRFEGKFTSMEDFDLEAVQAIVTKAING